MDFAGARKYILGRMSKELNPSLTYHTVEHTLDMHGAVIRLMEMEKIVDEHERLLIETAAIYHDAGMMISYNDHETQSVLIAGEMLPKFGYSLEDIDEVAGLILVTKLPQMPTTLHEKILCDADLDSLGRDDFFVESFKLQLEWNLTFEIKFFTGHTYFTESGRALRQEKKRKNLLEITTILERLK
jgi:predicted metal-dependent HD superfamily phosphohydrolase